MNLVENFLPSPFHLEIKNLLESESFPWFFHSNCTDNYKNSINNYGFSHLIFDSNTNKKSEMFDFFYPMAYFIKGLERVIRIRIGMQTKVSDDFNYINKMHYDFKNLNNDKVLLYYVNSSDGETLFFNKNKEKIFSQKPIENSALFFDGNILHSSSHPKENSHRIAININYF